VYGLRHIADNRRYLSILLGCLLKQPVFWWRLGRMRRLRNGKEMARANTVQFLTEIAVFLRGRFSEGQAVLGNSFQNTLHWVNFVARSTPYLIDLLI
jgi:hypothetical protein